MKKGRKVIINGNITQKVIIWLTVAIYVPFGLVQFFSSADLLDYSTDWHKILQFAVAVVAGYMPMVGSLLGFYVGYYFWGWRWLNLIFAIPILFSLFLISLILIKLRFKKEIALLNGDTVSNR